MIKWVWVIPREWSERNGFQHFFGEKDVSFGCRENRLR